MSEKSSKDFEFRIDDLQTDGLKLKQNPSFYCFNCDSVMLANLVRLTGKSKALELGAGSGVISVLLTGKRKLRHITAVEKQEEMAAQGITPEEEEKFETVSEVVLNQHKDIEDMAETTKRIETADNRIHALRTENLLLKNEIFDLKRENAEIRKEAKDRDRETKKELEKMIKELREDVFFYRLKRKIRHISGKDQ